MILNWIFDPSLDGRKCSKADVLMCLFCKAQQVGMRAHQTAWEIFLDGKSFSFSAQKTLLDFLAKVSAIVKNERKGGRIVCFVWDLHYTLAFFPPSFLPTKKDGERIIEAEHGSIILRCFRRIIRHISSRRPESAAQLAEMVAGYKQQIGLPYPSIPLSASGVIYKRLRKIKAGSEEYKAWTKTELSAVDYFELKKSFYSGLCAVNPRYQNKLVSARGYDVCSSYAYNLLTGLFPAGPPKRLPSISPQEIQKFRKNRCCCVASFEFKNFSLSGEIPSIFTLNGSGSKYLAQAPSFCGNTLERADAITACLTDIDFLQLRAIASWDELSISDALVYRAAPVPRALAHELCRSFAKKTARKTLLSKFFLNFTFGRVAERLIYDEDLSLTDLDKKIQKKLRSSAYVGNYAAGVYVAAYGRMAMYEIVGENFVKCDTDCIVGIDEERVDAANGRRREWMRHCLTKWHGLSDTDAGSFLSLRPFCGEWRAMEQDGAELTQLVAKGPKQSLLFYGDNPAFSVSGISPAALRRFFIAELGEPNIRRWSDLFILGFTVPGKYSERYILAAKEEDGERFGLKIPLPYTVGGLPSLEEFYLEEEFL